MLIPYPNCCPFRKRLEMLTVSQTSPTDRPGGRQACRQQGFRDYILCVMTTWVRLPGLLKNEPVQKWENFVRKKIKTNQNQNQNQTKPSSMLTTNRRVNTEWTNANWNEEEWACFLRLRIIWMRVTVSTKKCTRCVCLDDKEKTFENFIKRKEFINKKYFNQNSIDRDWTYRFGGLKTQCGLMDTVLYLISVKLLTMQTPGALLTQYCSVMQY